MEGSVEGRSFVLVVDYLEGKKQEGFFLMMWSNPIKRLNLHFCKTYQKKKLLFCILLRIGLGCIQRTILFLCQILQIGQVLNKEKVSLAFCFYQDLFVYFVCNWFTYFKVLLIHVLFLPIKKINKRTNKRIKWKKQENIICIILLWLKVVCKKNSFAKFCVWANISSFHIMFGLSSHV